MIIIKLIYKNQKMTKHKIIKIANKQKTFNFNKY
jgi:hypothetical protein